MDSGDYALVAIRRYRTPDGEATCVNESGACEFLARARDGERWACGFFRRAPLIEWDQATQRMMPHGECPAWRDR